MRHSSGCENFEATAPSRRDLLRIGGAGALSLALSGHLAAAERKGHKRRIDSIIFLHQYGGPAQHDTFDMKPNAPEQIRNIFRPIATNVPGIQVCELLPRTAKVMNKVCLIRSVQHTMKNHNSAGYYSLTGHAPPTDDQRLRDSSDLFPAYGSVVDKLSPAVTGTPTFVSYPYVIRDGSVTPGQHASFLGKAYDPLFISQDPSSPDFALPELSLPANVTAERMQYRREMLNLIDRQIGLLEHAAQARGIDESYQKALAMLSSAKLKHAFDLSQEPPAVRAKYGPTTYGQGCLLARRLVEAGVRFVTVYLSASIGGDRGGWDTHGFNGKPMNPILKNYLLPITDQTLPTLIEDLSERGFLDRTLVMWFGEFGRSPRINKEAGRDHWPQCYPVLLAGGGVRRGFVYGASDKIGAFPAIDPVSPDDVAATMFALLGIDPATEIRDLLGRPFPIAKGKTIDAVIA